MNQSRTKTDKASILAVDDSPMTLEILQRNLEGAGYGVVSASSVAEAIGCLEQTAFDLVITDIKMPKVSGLELLKYVKENLKQTEIMIITGYPFCPRGGGSGQGRRRGLSHQALY